MDIAEYVAHDAVALAELVRGKHVSAQELFDCALAQIERLNPSLNAIVHSLCDRAQSKLDAGLPEGVLAP